MFILVSHEKGSSSENLLLCLEAAQAFPPPPFLGYILPLFFFSRWKLGACSSANRRARTARNSIGKCRKVERESTHEFTRSTFLRHGAPLDSQNSSRCATVATFMKI